MGTQLDSVLANTDTCLAVRDARGVLYEHNDAATFAPASTQKLLVAAAALDLLGPAYRFTTTVVAAGRPVNGVAANLWLVGGGDPVLASPEFIAYMASLPPGSGPIPSTPISSLVSQLAAAGVHTVPGGIHGDDSRYEELRFLPSWRPGYVQEADAAPLGALEVDHGLDRWHPDVLTTDPTGHAAGVLARLMSSVQGADGFAPAGAVTLASVTSPPLDQIVEFMLRTSDNTIAEMLVRELSFHGGARPGTTAGGVGIVMTEAAKLGLPTAGLSLVDGSGLSPDDRVRCDTLLGALALGGQAPFAPIAAGLPEAGVSGTLVHRFLGTPAAGHLFAKTGSIAGVVGMVGTLDEDASDPVSFALLANGTFSYAVGLGLEDRVVAALGSP